MSTTILQENRATITLGGHPSQRCPDELLDRYKALVDEQRMSWTEHLRLTRLGSTRRRGVSRRIFLGARGLGRLAARRYLKR